MERLKLWHVAIILFVVCLITYSNSLHNDFMMDDQGLLLQNTRMHNWKFIYYQFIPDLDKILQVGVAGGSVYYRPMAHIVPMLCYLIFQDNATGYHIINLILFFSTCFSVFILIRQLFVNQSLAFITSLLFAVHPINGLFVNYITASVYGVQMIALSWALITFALTLKNRGNLSALYTISFFCFIIALLCHETSVVFPFYLMSTLFFLKKYSLRQSFMKCIPYIFLMIIFLISRMRFASLGSSILDKLFLSGITFFEFTATFVKLILWYVSKFILPQGIVIKWVTPITQENIFLWNLAFLLLCLSIIAIYRLKDKYPSVMWSLSWLVIGFAPVAFACFFQVHIGLIIEPHWLFFTSIGIFVSMALLLLNLRKILKLKKPFHILIIVVLLSVFVSISISYNRLWGDEEQYSRFWSKQAPGLKAPIFYLASVYMDKGEYREARRHFLNIIENAFTDWQIYNNLGLMDMDENNYDRAIYNFQMALKIFPESSVSHNNLGIAYLYKDESGLAEEAFFKAVLFNRFFLEPRLNLAGIYKKRGELSKAERLYLDNLDITPYHKPSLFHLMDIYFSQDKESEALSVAKKIFQNNRNNEVLLSCAGILASKNYHKFALDFYEKALMQDPKNEDVYLELGKFYGNYNNFELAIATWKQGLSLAPHDERFHILIQQAKRLEKEIDGK